MKEKFIKSTAHDFLQKFPISENTLICLRCGQVATIGCTPDRCVPHYEGERSGFIPEEVDMAK